MVQKVNNVFLGHCKSVDKIIIIKESICSLCDSAEFGDLSKSEFNYLMNKINRAFKSYPLKSNNCIAIKVYNIVNEAKHIINWFKIKINAYNFIDYEKYYIFVSKILDYALLVLEGNNTEEQFKSLEEEVASMSDNENTKLLRCILDRFNKIN